MNEAVEHQKDEVAGMDLGANQHPADNRRAGEPHRITRILNVLLMACLALSLGMTTVQLLDAHRSLIQESINEITYASHGWTPSHYGMGVSNFLWYAREGSEIAGLGFFGTRVLWCSLFVAGVFTWYCRKASREFTKIDNYLPVFIIALPEVIVLLQRGLAPGLWCWLGLVGGLVGHVWTTRGHRTKIASVGLFVALVAVLACAATITFIAYRQPEGVSEGVRQETMGKGSAIGRQTDLSKRDQTVRGKHYLMETVGSRIAGIMPWATRWYGDINTYGFDPSIEQIVLVDENGRRSILYSEPVTDGDHEIYSWRALDYDIPGARMWDVIVNKGPDKHYSGEAAYRIWIDDGSSQGETDGRTSTDATVRDAERAMEEKAAAEEVEQQVEQTMSEMAETMAEIQATGNDAAIEEVRTILRERRKHWEEQQRLEEERQKAESEQSQDTD